MKIQVLEDSIVNIKADALLTTVRSDTIPLGRIDSVIGRCAKSQFHRQVHRALSNDPLTKVIVAKRRQYHEGQFKHVVFVIDDNLEPLEDIVGLGLSTAATAGFQTISLPAIRFRTGKHEERTGKIRSIVSSIVSHASSVDTPLSEVTIAIYRDPQLAEEFRSGVNQTFSCP